MELKTIFFDLDDTLYPSSCGLWSLIRQRMEQYMHDKLSFEWDEIPEARRHFFETYGTTLRGLQLTRQIDTEEYLAYVHDVPIEQYLTPDPCLRDFLLALPYRRLILTNADRNHAARVTRHLGIEDCFEHVIDIHQLAPSCKPEVEAFHRALAVAGENDARSCLFIDDSARNLDGAAAVGFNTVMISGAFSTSTSHPLVHSLYELPGLLQPIEPDGEK